VNTGNKAQEEASHGGYTLGFEQGVIFLTFLTKS